jgi:hypothetical protein
MCGPVTEEVGGWRKLQCKKLHSLHPSSVSIMVILSSR